MSRGSRPWRIALSIFKGGTRLPWQRRWRKGNCVRSATRTSWMISSRVYPSFLFICGVQEYVESMARTPGNSIQQG